MSATSKVQPRVDVQVSCREWLRLNGYEDVADSIDALTRKWRYEGRKTRRDWWLVLAGTREGAPHVVDGVTFPVLKAARRRQGFPTDVPGAVERTPHELAPTIRQQARWPQPFKRVLR